MYNYTKVYLAFWFYSSMVRAVDEEMIVTGQGITPHHTTPYNTRSYGKVQGSQETECSEADVWATALIGAFRGKNGKVQVGMLNNLRIRLI